MLNDYDPGEVYMPSLDISETKFRIDKIRKGDTPPLVPRHQWFSISLRGKWSPVARNGRSSLDQASSRDRHPHYLPLPKARKQRVKDATQVLTKIS